MLRRIFYRKKIYGIQTFVCVHAHELFKFAGANLSVFAVVHDRSKPFKIKKSGKRDLNPRPPSPEPGALPTALLPELKKV